MRVLIGCFCLTLLSAVAAGPEAKGSQPKVELLMFDGCPNSPKMRANLLAAMKVLGLSQNLKVVDIMKLPAGDMRTGYGSPTVLVAGRDLFGHGQPKPGETAVSCRIYAAGVPSAADIEKHLREFLAKNHK